VTVFVDTSACLAFTAASDKDHAAARTIYGDLVQRDERLVTTSYVLAEAMGLIQHRLGWEPLQRFAATAATFDVAWIDASRHRAAEQVLFGLHRRRVNIVDAASFVVMREMGISTAFAFDPDFAQEGFRVIGPGAG
jgi:predicted nucleic acid-binding protein